MLTNRSLSTKQSGRHVDNSVQPATQGRHAPKEKKTMFYFRADQSGSLNRSKPNNGGTNQECPLRDTVDICRRLPVAPFPWPSGPSRRARVWSKLLRCRQHPFHPRRPDVASVVAGHGREAGGEGGPVPAGANAASGVPLRLAPTLKQAVAVAATDGSGADNRGETRPRRVLVVALIGAGGASASARYRKGGRIRAHARARARLVAVGRWIWRR